MLLVARQVTGRRRRATPRSDVIFTGYREEARIPRSLYRRAREDRNPDWCATRTSGLTQKGVG